MTGPVQSSGNAPFGGYVFNGPATGPAPGDFNKSPGIWQTLYNEAAIKIGLPQVKADAKFPPDGLVVRELERQNNVYHAQQRGPTAHAEKLVNEARIPGIFSDSVDTPRLAAEIVALRRDLPADAKQIENEIMNKLGAKNGGAGDQSRFQQDLRAAASHATTADQKLQSAADRGAPRPPAPTRAQISADTNALITQATTYHFNGKLGTTTENFSIASIAAKVAERAETDPVGAQLVRADLTARLTPAEGDKLNRLLAGEGGFWENMGVAMYDPVDGGIGVVKGLANDGIWVLNAMGKGELLRAAGEAEQAAAMQSLFGQDKAAALSSQSADTLRDASKADAIPSIPYSNAAQQGGSNAKTVAELAGGAKAVYGAGKWAVKNAPELLAKRSDDVAEVAETLIDRGRRILGDMPLNSKSLDDLYQAGKLTMDEARVLAKSVGWKSADGRTIYPPNNGFHNGFKEITIKKGDQIIIDRYGDARGKFASPLGEAKDARALPTDTDFSSGNYHIYKVEGDIKVNVGKATPWFDQPGGATQYQLPQSIDNLLFNDILKELRR